MLRCELMSWLLQRDSLRADLDSKFSVIFHSYGQELLNVQDMYQRMREKPPRARNLPPVFGAISWARHLLNRIQAPMKSFQENKKLLETRDGRKIVKTYNKMIRILVAFECVWFDAWAAQIEKAKAGLYATLIVRHPTNRKLFVNFDPGAYSIRACLSVHPVCVLRAVSSGVLNNLQLRAILSAALMLAAHTVPSHTWALFCLLPQRSYS
jgi:hypothetical protein